MKFTILNVGCLLLAATLISSAHDHFAAGVANLDNNGQPDAGEALAVYGPDTSVRVFHMLARPTGFRPVQKCGGYYVLDENARTLFPNDAFSFTALSDGQEEIEEENHAHTGAWIWIEITAVDGPPGANFGFWEVGRAAAHDSPTISFPTGQATGNYGFVVSGGADSEEQDPHGHFHGRSWTADKPGDYFVSFRFVDRSTTGPGGGPWHAPSETFVFHFQAGPSFQPTGSVSPGGYTLTWPSLMGVWEPFQTGIEFKVLRYTNPKDGWTQIGSVTGTTAATATFNDASPPSGAAFYRLAYDWADAATP